MLVGQTKRMIMSVPKFNYCDVTRQIRSLPYISEGIDQLAKHRDGRMGCPIRVKKCFKLTNYTVAEQEYTILGMVMAKDKQRYMMDIKVTDENKLPAKVVVKYEFFLLFTK
jgi:hypothetical protein